MQQCHAIQGQKPFFSYLRSPYKIPKKVEVPTREVQSQKADLLSTSYALTCNIKPLESAASWGFVNHFGNQQYVPMIQELSSFAQEVENATGRKIPEVFYRRGAQLIREYNRLDVGNFFVLGVPRDRLASWVYDSLPYNVPTGKKVETIVDTPDVSREGTLATVVLSKDVLDPESGLVIVEANDLAQVEAFCRGLSFTEPSEFEEFRSIADFSKDEADSRANIDQKLDILSADFTRWLKAGEEPSPNSVYEDFDPGDFPALLP
jgi:hypothetical protein